MNPLYLDDKNGMISLYLDGALRPFPDMATLFTII